MVRSDFLLRVHILSMFKPPARNMFCIQTDGHAASNWNNSGLVVFSHFGENQVSEWQTGPSYRDREGSQFCPFDSNLDIFVSEFIVNWT